MIVLDMTLATRQSATHTRALLSVDSLCVSYSVRQGLRRSAHEICRAVDDVSFEIASGSTLGLVGESGCGKTTLARTIMRLEKPTSGHIYFGGHEVLESRGDHLRRIRKQIQTIFQDPIGSLNPRMRIKDIISEPLVIHNIGDRQSRRHAINHLLRKVGLDPMDADRYPHEFSGGQRQRIGIARAMALRPKMIICDEPVSALDVSMQAQILNLLTDLREELHLSLLFITHNVAVAHHICDRIAVMKSGKIVEIADADTLFSNPQHEYTQTLLAAAPKTSFA